MKAGLSTLLNDCRSSTIYCTNRLFSCMINFLTHTLNGYLGASVISDLPRRWLKCKFFLKASGHSWNTVLLYFSVSKFKLSIQQLFCFQICIKALKETLTDTICLTWFFFFLLKFVLGDTQSQVITGYLKKQPINNIWIYIVCTKIRQVVFWEHILWDNQWSWSIQNCNELTSSFFEREICPIMHNLI